MMKKDFLQLLSGYQAFREKYASGDHSVMQQLSDHGQQPEVMVIACCDSRVDPALILQCDPGDLFVVRNVASIVPPYEKDSGHHGVSAALEFGICFLQVKHLILLGHSQCGGIHALLGKQPLPSNDFISTWVSLIKTEKTAELDPDDCAKHALQQSYQHCLSFPWIQERVAQHRLKIHTWFFDIKMGQIFSASAPDPEYRLLDTTI